MIEPLIESLDAESNGLVRKYINRSLNWITQANLPPQISQWRIWWSRNSAKMGIKKDEFKPLEPNWGDLPDLSGGDDQ